MGIASLTLFYLGSGKTLLPGGAIMPPPPLIYVNLRGQSEEDIINLIHQYVYTELWKEKTFSVG